jgi:hypothetical protein
MKSSDSRVDAYIAKAAAFAQPILERLRERVHRACPEIEESLKWGAPSFLYRGKILCSMAAFKQHASFGFWQHAEVMGASVQRDGMGSFGKMRALGDAPTQRTLTPLIRKAMDLIDAGGAVPGPRKSPASRSATDIPPDLSAALRTDPAASETFNALAPGQRREYVDWIVEAKREQTRGRRVAQAIEWLAEGKPRHWKYRNG